MKQKPDALSAAELRRLAEAKLAEQKSRRPPSHGRARLGHELEVHQIELEMQNAALRESQAEVEAGLTRYADLYDFAPAAYFTLDRDDTIRELNLAAADLLGSVRTQLVGRRLAQFVAEGSRATFRKALDQTFLGGAKRSCDVELAIEGRPPAAVTMGLTLSADGTGCRLIAVDVTAQRRAEEAVRATEARLRLLVDAVKDYAIVLLDPRGRVTSWNTGAAAIAGFSADEILGQHFEVLYPAEARTAGAPQRALALALADGRFEEEGWRVRKDGSRFWAHVVITPVRDEHGQVTSFAKVTRDLSERKAAERRLALVESAPDGILLVAADGRIVHTNPRTAALFGYAPEELVGRALEDLVPERARGKHVALRGAYAAAPTVRAMGSAASSVTGLRKDGTEFPVEISLGPQQGPEGKLVVAFIRDMTDLRRLQRAQAVAADRVTRLQSLTAALGGAMTPDEAAAVIVSAGLAAVGTSSGAVARTVENGRKLEHLRFENEPLAELSPVLERLTGSPAEVVAGRRRISVDVPTPVCDAVRSRAGVWLESPAAIQAAYPAFAPVLERAGHRAMVCLPLISRDEVVGALRLDFTQPRKFDHEERAFLNAVASQCASAMDRAQLYEDALEARDRAERATVLRDEMLSIVAHDLGNPIHAIGLQARRLLTIAPPGPTGDGCREAASSIDRGVRSMALLIEDLADVAIIDSGQLRTRLEERDALAIVKAAADLFLPACREKGVELVAQAEALPLRCDADRVQQALGNLVANALKHTPAGGTIAILAEPAGPAVRFSVADTGSGISEEAREHIFERYWRGKTRDLTKGVGLGLFIVKGIVAAHGGDVSVESEVGRGTTFRFTLPTEPSGPGPSTARRS